MLPDTLLLPNYIPAHRILVNEELNIIFLVVFILRILAFLTLVLVVKDWFSEPEMRLYHDVLVPSGNWGVVWYGGDGWAFSLVSVLPTNPKKTKVVPSCPHRDMAQ